MSKKVLLGMSGGVDSSVCALLLKQQGYEVIGATMQLWENNNINGEISNDAKKLCDKLEIQHYTFKFVDEFKKYVIDDFVCSYMNAVTPNPCIECNKFLKFDLLYKKAQELGCEYIATGHYAKIEFIDKYSKYMITKSNSDKKDQTYVLYNIKSDILDKVIFPLGCFETKEQIRQIAYNNGLESAKKADSQEICFIPDNNYVKFLEEYTKEKIKPGDIVDTLGNVVGKHNGLINYTIGQRKGMGITHSTPLYVVKLDKEKNQVIVGEEKELYSSTLYANNLNFYIDNIPQNLEVNVKIRYSHKGDKAILNVSNGIAKIDFIQPQKSITPGQSAVIYVDNVLIGGGKII